MRLSFSTRGRFGGNWQDQIRLALENGFSGVEVYDAYKDASLVGPGAPLSPDAALLTLRQLRERGSGLLVVRGRAMPLVRAFHEINAFPLDRIAD